MLQIVIKRYFRPDARLHSTVHRQVLHTNRSVLTGQPVELPVGRLLLRRSPKGSMPGATLRTAPASRDCVREIRPMLSPPSRRLALSLSREAVG